MKELNKIFVDFNNVDVKGRIRLNTNGTVRDINEKNIQLNPGMDLLLDDGEELSIVGVIEFSKEENIWVAKIDWSKLNGIGLNE